MSASQVKDFTKGNITKQLILFSLPLFLSNLLQVVYNMVDMMVVGNVLGEAGISSVSVGGDVSAFLTFVAMGFANAGQVLIARYIGSGQQKKIGKFVGTMSSFLAVSAFAISIIGVVSRSGILWLMRTPGDAWQGALDYSTICMVGLIFIYGYNVVSAILRGMGDSKHPFIFISIAAVLNLLLDLLFVIVLGMGAGGAALATVISQAVSFISCTVFLYFKRAEFGLDMKIRDFIRWDKPMLSDLLKLGTPMAIKMASIQISKLFVNAFVNNYGTGVSAFAGIANKLGSVSNLISAALNTAGSTLVGQNIAAGKFSRVNAILLRLAAITLTIAILLSLVICFFPAEFFSMFTSEESGEVISLAYGFVPIAVLLFFGSALRAIMNALMNGSANHKINFATAIFDGIVMRIGLAVLFGLVLDMKHYGFWLGDALAGFTPFVIGIVFYLSGRWKRGAKVESE